jgi:suppressor of ftsI
MVMKPTYFSIGVLMAIGLLLVSCAQQSSGMNHNMHGGESSSSNSQVTLTPMERSIDGLLDAKPMSVIKTSPDKAIKLSADIVKKDIDGSTIRMFGYNGMIAGPLLKAKQGEFFKVDFTNNIDMDTTVHWHGVRIENKYDGIPGVTQDPVKPLDSFHYEVRFPDAGLYWYHPHIREDYQQELGLYGAILVEPKVNEYNAVNKEEVIILDDIKLDGNDVPPYMDNQINHALMGRFGNVMLVNGQTEYSLNVKKGDVVRFYIGNVANVRPFKISFTNAKMKVVGGDVGLFQHDFFADTLIIGPAERYIVEVLFENTGSSQLKHSTHHGTYILGDIEVSNEQTSNDHSSSFSKTREYGAKKELDQYKSYSGKEPDVDWKLTINVQGMGRMMHADEDGLEYEDPMPMMAPLMSNRTLEWQIVDMKTGKANMESHYQWDVEDLVKIRILNDKESMHPMQHPIHFHGNRFLVLSKNGIPEENLVWKDTTLVPVGATYDILLEISNPGEWMAHCHIAEHLQSGMMVHFSVDGEYDPLMES